MEIWQRKQIRNCDGKKGVRAEIKGNPGCDAACKDCITKRRKH